MKYEMIQKQLENMLILHQVPSVSVTVYHKGAYQHFSAGYKDIENAAVPDINTTYAIGSCSKSFTAGAIAVLCDQGLLDLDTRVREYIPELEMYDSYAGANLTVRDMLSHRCGLPRHELAWYSRLSEYTEADFIRMLRYLEPNQPFRYKMQYQNLMYALAGFVISRVSGMPWAQFIEKYLSAPLELGYVSYDAPELAAAPDPAAGYRFQKASAGNQRVEYATLGAMRAAGSMGMSSHQLAMWNVMLMHEGMSGGKQIISKKMIHEMTSPQMLISDPIAEPLAGYVDLQSYGLGLFLESYRGHKVIHHSGHIDGFISEQCFVPSEDFACTVLTNSEAPFGARAVRYCLLDNLFGAEPKDWVKDLSDYLAKIRSAQTTQEKPVSDPAAPCPVALAKICGEYTNLGYGSISVTASDDRLFLKMGTLTLTGTHCRNQFFIFTEDNLLEGELLEGQIDLNMAGEVLGIGIMLDGASKKPVHFTRCGYEK